MMLRDLIINWQITRDIKRNITPARKSKQESARKGQSTELRNRLAKALRLKAEGLL